ncbi:hypothetical protein D1P53_005426 [Cryptococcus gattii VGV]|nr:hypothetical protein D1P53_005426 [Cryptococcus gattii VGV]
MEGSPLSKFPPITASSSSSASTNGASGKRKSTLLTFLRRPSVEGSTIAVPQRQSVFHDMERRPQKPLRQEELLSVVGGEKDVDPNLPTVRLVPPDDEGEPMMLYPFPLSPPPSLDTQSPPQQRTPPLAPSTPSPMPRRPLATANGPRPTSAFTTNPAWNGMADGFVLPPPRFSRSGAGFNPRGRASVIMPKTKTQVVEEKKRRMSAMMEWEMGYGSADRQVMDRPMLIRQGVKPPNVLEAEEERAAMAKITPQSELTNPDEEEKIEELSEEPATAASTPSAPTAPGPPIVTVNTESPVIGQPPAQLTKDHPSQPATSKPSKPSRRSRTLSLSAAFSAPLFTKNESPATTSVPPLPPVPPVPTEQTKRVPKKQKSLKNLFFSSSTPPTTTLGPSNCDNSSQVAEKEHKDKLETSKEKKPLLTKRRSKPSLHINVNATKSSSSLKSAPTTSSSSKTSAAPITPTLSSGRSEKTSSISTTPSTASASATASKPKLNKRFSLSNMAVFKKRSNSAPVFENRSLADMESGNAKDEVPKVPELPKAYKKEKEARRTMSEMFPAKEEVAVLPQAPFTDEIVASPVAEVPKSIIEPPRTHSADISTGSSLTHSPSDSTSTIDPTSTSVSSDMSDVDDEDDILNAQFMQLPSPRSPIDRDPAASLQDLLNNAPGRKSEVVVVQEGRRSLEALVVLGPTSVRPNAVPANSRVSASGSEASFASCDSGSTLNFGTSPQRKQSLGPGAVRRRSAGSDESDDVEGLVTPVQDSVEMFRVQRQRQESQSEESNAGESTDSEGMRLIKNRSSRKICPTVSPINASSTSRSAPTRNLPAPPETMSLEAKKKLGSLHFDILGLNFGEWDERREEVPVRA